MSENTEGM